MFSCVMRFTSGKLSPGTGGMNLTQVPEQAGTEPGQGTGLAMSTLLIQPLG